ncbi:MAG: DUF4091 domain-containing protein [Lentisphaerae bacterium]|jgi:hypothetical protein|nr:DUF4091 domain-containing protein [Lentisphaerota bacterium]MBT4817018.1 DUF4091 domain-containing protein [Lentisphaerota bacterium]MBT5604720.1 DUF4091 domain-containing protein [Lentisphaerota bacterium]MBT7058106.1 DUF4091 domain-containing protein [Lentisphaerota bacterium]MBT7841794.1 DUF4091 domain-containing protein [Lentisphaerota bacterium]
MSSRLITVGVLCMCCWSVAQQVDVPNATFESGANTPAAWTLSGGSGTWLPAGTAGESRAIAVTGTGSDTNYWRSGNLPLLPARVYRLSFRARSLGGSGGTPVTGPIFCNRDLGSVPDEWKTFQSIFATPPLIDPESAWLRFGQWHISGQIAFDDIALTEVEPVHRRQANLELGAGESLEGRAYTFQAPLNGTSRNYSRALSSFACGFNSNRWVFGANREVVYRHQVGNRQQTEARIETGIRWHAGGELAVDVSADGERWTTIGTKAEVGDVALAIPKALLPAREIWVRLRAQARKQVGTESDPGSFQIGQYSYTATVDGPPVELRGDTQFLSVKTCSPTLGVNILSLGDGLPGANNVVEAELTNRGTVALPISPRVRMSWDGGNRDYTGTPTELPAGATKTIRSPYDVPVTGEVTLAFTLGKAAEFHGRVELYVPEFFDMSYGELVPGTTEGTQLWWTHSGWKVPQTRPAPVARGKAVRISAARNETDAAQLIVRPARRLTGLTATASALRGANGAQIPAASVEVLRVGYVPVTRTTDHTGVIGPWPDPLPPFKGPIDVAAGDNQPLWVRVHVPRNVPSGTYEGRVCLRAQNMNADVPLQVRVYDFDLPDRMTCTTAFGFSAPTVWRYQKIPGPAQRRDVLAKYFANYSAHHISPYNLAPLDPFRVSWPNASAWKGGARDRNVKYAGSGSIRLQDDSLTGNVSTQFAEPITIPKGGLRLTFRYRTAKPGHAFIVTFNHSDSNRQWMSGRNNDMRITGDGTWQLFDRTVTRFPSGAQSLILTLWATTYREDGALTGTVWCDDVSLTDATTGKGLVTGGEFEPVEADSLTPLFDWSAWDRAMTEAIETYHFNSFRFPIQGLGGGTFHARRDPDLLGYTEDTPEYQHAFRAFCSAVESHLQEKGWLDEAYVYWFDEPDPKDYGFVMNGFHKLKKEAPGLRRMLTEQVEDGLVGGPNLWCPISNHFDLEDAEERRAEGDQFWWYVCTGPKAPYCTLFIDHPGTEMRVWLWQTWQRKIEGILVWATNYWTSGCAYPDYAHPQNPYEDPMGWVSGYSTEAGTKRPWGNGDGRFIYPPEAAADAQQEGPVLEGPVDSIRWEMLRDGIEDYEYHAILKRLIEEKKGQLSAQRTQQLKALLDVPEAITADATTFTKDPALIEARRDQIATAIEALSVRK